MRANLVHSSGLRSTTTTRRLSVLRSHKQLSFVGATELLLRLRSGDCPRVRTNVWTARTAETNQGARGLDRITVRLLSSCFDPRKVKNSGSTPSVQELPVDAYPSLSSCLDRHLLDQLWQTVGPLRRSRMERFDPAKLRGEIASATMKTLIRNRMNNACGCIPGTRSSSRHDFPQIGHKRS